MEAQGECVGSLDLGVGQILSAAYTQNMMEFKEPRRGTGDGFAWFLYLDGKQVVASLSSIEGGYIKEVTSKSAEEAERGSGISGTLGVSGVKVETKASKDRKLRYEEEFIRSRTGYSTVSTLLKKLREDDLIGQVGFYSPEYHERMREGDLYEFKGRIRFHPFHSVAYVAQGWEDSRENLGGSEDDAFVEMIGKIENALYGKNKPRESYVVFAEIDGADAEYKVVMPIKKEQLLVSSLDEFSSEATFVAQVRRKLTSGQKYQAAKLVRKTPMISPSDETFMLRIAPILQNLPGVKEEGIEISEADVILREPALIMKPLCIYKG